MLYLNRLAGFRPRSIVHFSRKMSKFYVRNVVGESVVDISFEFSPIPENASSGRLYNSSRPKEELISCSLERISNNINKHVNKKLKKKQKTDEAEGVSIKLYDVDGVTPIPDQTEIENALKHRSILMINNQKFTVDVNPPKCLGIKVPQTVMVDFPIYPNIDIEFADLSHSEYKWEKIKYKDSVENQNKKRNNPNPAEVIERIEIGRELQYSPTLADIGYHLSLTCIPKKGDREGRQVYAETKFEVTAGPGPCPFELRHKFTESETEVGSMRVVSYNILADLYADQDYSRDVLYNYCPPYALSLDYRKPLIIKELKGYNADLLCLQEVDHKLFVGDLSTAMDQMGYDGVFKEKAGEVREGSAIFYRRSKFRLICEHYECIKDFMERDRCCEDLVKKTYALPALKEILQTRTTIIHVVALESLDNPGHVLLLANTHLYFHPNASHIRLIQIITAMRFIGKLMHEYRKQKPCLIFCGDFNSDPEHGIYEFMTTKHVGESHRDWTRGGEEQFVQEMNFSHKLNLDSGCGLPDFTNYTAGFHGHLDFIFYDKDNLEVSEVVPQPELKDVEFHTALPSIVFPSDHIAQVCVLKYKEKPSTASQL